MWSVLLVLACSGAPEAPGTPVAEPGSGGLAGSSGLAGGGAPAGSSASAGSFEARRKALAAEIRVLVADLEAAGRYDCCIETPCNLCATRTGGCRCGDGLRRGEPVCEECALMWAQGLGAEPDVNPKDVRSFLEASRRPGELRCGEERPASSEGTAPPPSR